MPEAATSEYKLVMCVGGGGGEGGCLEPAHFTVHSCQQSSIIVYWSPLMQIMEFIFTSFRVSFSSCGYSERGDPPFFRDSNPSEPLSFDVVLDSLSQTLWCNWHSRVLLRSVNDKLRVTDMAESSSTVSIWHGRVLYEPQSAKFYGMTSSSLKMELSFKKVYDRASI